MRSAQQEAGTKVTTLEDVWLLDFLIISKQRICIRFAINGLCKDASIYMPPKYTEDLQVLGPLAEEQERMREIC